MISWEKTLKSEIILRNHENLERIEICLGRLNEEQVWIKPNSQTNSIANLILHLCGNMTQYIQSSLGNQPDHRQRTQEFLRKDGLSKQELFLKIKDCVLNANQVINQVSEKRILTQKEVQGFTMPGMGNLIHVAEHLSYHTGQIALLTKLLVEEDLGFYAGLDLDINNSSEK